MGRSEHRAQRKRGFYRMLASASPGARLLEIGDVQATLAPVRPWFSVFNSVLYRDVRSLRAALPRLAHEYERAGIAAWTVWVPPGDEEAKDLLLDAGHVCDGTPLLMAAPISTIELHSPIRLELLDCPTWRDVARCNDRAHGVLEPWSMAAVFETPDDPASHLYAATDEGRVVSALIAREHGHDCYFWFVATVPEAQRRGYARELMRHALREAKRRGCETTSLESTVAGEGLYASMGYTSLGRYEMWERRLT
jgi:ribosomal protein S18 acetylase RimI-like enzyme